MHKKLLLFGGTGFVGSRIACKALARGYKVIIATRSGAPIAGSPLHALAERVRRIGAAAAVMEVTQSRGGSGYHPTAIYVHEGGATSILGAPMQSAGGECGLEFTSIDATVPSQVFHVVRDHPDATAIITCVGLLTCNHDKAKRVNGDANINICTSAFQEKLAPALTKLVYVSTEPFHKHCPHILGSKRLLQGYFEGKETAERAVLESASGRGVVLRPGFIYGTRYLPLYFLTNTAVPLPLGIIGYPLDRLLRAVRSRKLLVPPVYVDVVAETAIRACEWALLPNLSFGGVVDVYGMQQICQKKDPTLQPPHATASSPSSKL